MYCTNCGELIREKAKFCENCGVEISTFGLNENTEKPNIESLKQGDMDHGLIPEEDENTPDDIQLFVGKKHEYYRKQWQKMDEQKKNTSFNFAAFFFAFLWFGYRKMYKYVFIFSLLFLAIDFLLLSIIHIIDIDFYTPGIDRAINLGVAVFFGILGNHFYRSHMGSQITKIEGKATDENERNMMVIRKGGTSIGGIFLAILIFISVYLIPTIAFTDDANPIEAVRTGSFYDYPDITVEMLFDEVFYQTKWEADEIFDQFYAVNMAGIIIENGVDHDVEITFIYDDETGEFYIQDVTINQEFLTEYEIEEFLSYLFYTYEMGG